MFGGIKGTIPILLILFFASPCYSEPPTTFSLRYWIDSNAKEQIVFTLPNRFWEYTDVSHWEKYYESRLNFSLLLPPGTKINPSNLNLPNPKIRISLMRLNHYNFADGPCGETTPETGKNLKKLLQQAKTDEDGMGVIGVETSNVVMGGLITGPIKVAYVLSDCQGDVEPDELISFYDGQILFTKGDDVVNLFMDIPVLDDVKVRDSADYLKKLKINDSRVATGKTWDFFVKVARSIKPATAIK